jgi:RNA polymerase sigma-70 factor (ECF subfamily)
MSRHPKRREAHKTSSALSALVRRHLPALTSFVQREIAYHVANGDLLPDDLTPEDLVAAIVVRAGREFDRKPPDRDFKGWLFSVADAKIVAEIRKSARNRREFVKDLFELPSVPTPEAILENEELQEYVTRTLATLPDAWRRAFTLRYIEELPVTEIARILTRSELDVERDIECARNYLRERLIEAGLAPEGAQVQRMFSTVPPAHTNVPTPTPTPQ